MVISEIRLVCLLGAILSRYVELCTSPRTGEWFNITYMFRFNTMLKKVQELFTPCDEEILFKPSKSTPKQILKEFINSFPNCCKVLVHLPDVEFFLDNWKFAGKPVPFIPTLDDFAYWFKRDSLWFAEEEDAVPFGDPQRVNVLMGPVAASRINQIEPVGHILDDINRGSSELLSVSPPPHPGISRFHKSDPLEKLQESIPRDAKVRFKIDPWLAVLREWLACHPDLHRLIIEEHSFGCSEGSKMIENVLRKILKPKDDGRRLELIQDDESVVLRILEPQCVAELTTNVSASEFSAVFKYELSPESLAFTVKFVPERTLAPLQYTRDPELCLNA